MTLNANIRDRRCRFQGKLFSVLESKVGSQSNHEKARCDSLAPGEMPATDFWTCTSPRTIHAGLNSSIEPVST